MSLTTQMEMDQETSQYKRKVVKSLRRLFPKGVKPDEFSALLDALICLGDAIEETGSLGSEPFYYH